VSASPEIVGLSAKCNRQRTMDSCHFEILQGHVASSQT